METPTNTAKENQTTLFPTGQWNFTSLVDKDEQEEIMKAVPEKYVSLIFDVWDGEEEDVGNVFKLLGLTKHPLFREIHLYLVKRWIQFTKKPIPVSYTFDCNDLKELFDRNSNDYDLSYIEEYLCGRDGFWEPEDWYNYEWDSYMTDQIDENNWKTIMGIFGVDTQEVAENLLTESPQNEEEEELQEEHQEDIDEIQNFIVWANNDEYEYSVKNAMAKDIEDKLAEHFQHEGRLNTDNMGSKSWIIDGDLRDYVNDIWDNTEDVFEYHTEYLNNTLEDVIYDQIVHLLRLPEIVFASLMEEEYIFWEYCEGKKGECLEVETKYFDGYWQPDIDINESLSDRLGELTYEPEVTTPLHGQDEEQSINEFFPGTLMAVGKKPGDVWQLFLSEKWAAIGPQGFRMSYIIKKDAEIWAKTGKDDFGNDENKLKQDISWDEPESNTLKEEEVEQFDVKRWSRLNNLDKAYILEHGPGPIRNSKNIDIPEYVRRLLTKAIFEAKGGWGRAPVKFILYMKHDGEIVDIRGSASFTTIPNEFNIGNKVTLGDLIRFERTTNYSLTMKGNLNEKKEMSKRIIKEEIKEKIGLTPQRQFYLKQLSEENNRRFKPKELLRLADMIDNTTAGWMSAGGRQKVMDFLFKLRDSGLVNMYEAPDFLISGSRWFKKYVDFKHPELLVDYDEYMDEDDVDYYLNQQRKLVQELIKDSDGIRDVMISNVMGRKGDNASLEELTRELRPAAVDMLKLWMEFIT